MSNSVEENREAAPEVSIAEAQERVDRWIREVGVRYFSELTNLAQLVEEVGEVARILSRTYGDQSFKDKEKELDLSDELADVLFVSSAWRTRPGWISHRPSCATWTRRPSGMRPGTPPTRSWSPRRNERR